MLQNYRTVQLQTDKIRPCLVLCSRQPRLFEHIHWISLTKYSIGVHKLLLRNICNKKHWMYSWARFLLHLLWYRSLFKWVTLLRVYIICKKGQYLLPVKTKSSFNWQSRQKPQKASTLCYPTATVVTCHLLLTKLPMNVLHFKISHTHLTRGGICQNPGLIDTGEAVVLQADCKLLAHSWILEYDIMLNINFPEFPPFY